MRTRLLRSQPVAFGQQVALTELRHELERPRVAIDLNNSFRVAVAPSVQTVAATSVEQAFEGAPIRARFHLQIDDRPWRKMSKRDYSSRLFSRLSQPSGELDQHPLLPRGIATFTFRFDSAVLGRRLYQLHLVLLDGRVVRVTSHPRYADMTDFEIRKHVFGNCFYDREYVLWALYASDAFLSIGTEFNWRSYLRRNHYVPQWFHDLNGGIEPPLLSPDMLHREEGDLLSWEEQPLRDAVQRRIENVVCFGYQLRDDSLISSPFIIFMPPLALGPINVDALSTLANFGQAVFRWIVLGDFEIIKKAAEFYLHNDITTLKKLDPFFREYQLSTIQLEERFDCGHLTIARQDRLRAERLQADGSIPEEIIDWETDRGRTVITRPGELSSEVMSHDPYRHLIRFFNWLYIMYPWLIPRVWTLIVPYASKGYYGRKLYSGFYEIAQFFMDQKYRNGARKWFDDLFVSAIVISPDDREGVKKYDYYLGQEQRYFSTLWHDIENWHQQEDMHEMLANEEMCECSEDACGARKRKQKSIVECQVKLNTTRSKVAEHLADYTDNWYQKVDPVNVRGRKLLGDFAKHTRKAKRYFDLAVGYKNKTVYYTEAQLEDPELFENVTVWQEQSVRPEDVMYWTTSNRCPSLTVDECFEAEQRRVLPPETLRLAALEELDDFPETCYCGDVVGAPHIVGWRLTTLEDGTKKRVDVDCQQAWSREVTYFEDPHPERPSQFERDFSLIVSKLQEQRQGRDSHWEEINCSPCLLFGCPPGCQCGLQQELDQEWIRQEEEEMLGKRQPLN